MVAEKRSISDWYAESLRFTAFSSQDNGDLPLSQWWAGVTGGQPDEVVNKPKEREAVVAGRVGDATLILQHLPLRIDLRLEPAPKEAMEMIPLPNIGVLEKVSTEFAKNSANLIHQVGFPPINRMAYGAVALLPVESREKGYEQLEPYLPAVTIDPKNSSEFLYRINRLRESALGIPNLFLNRLNKWSVVTFKIFAGAPASVTMLPGRYFCRLELDINTAAEFPGELPKERLDDVLNELRTTADEIILNGDV
jgi:hypothetical protein